jgi:hypothetical protein
MTAPARVKQDDIKRVVAGAIAGGMSVGKIVVDANGSIMIFDAKVAPPAAQNDWDDELRG